MMHDQMVKPEKPAMLNQQQPEAFDGSNGIDFHTYFHTIQGEGPYTGDPAFFIRLAGCNLQCPMCDTEYTQGRERLSVPYFLEREFRPMYDAHKNTRLAVITGGEPTRQVIGHLCEMLFHCGLRVQIESNGVLKPDFKTQELIEGGEVTYVVSPKTARVHEYTVRAHYFKYVISADSLDPSDGLPIQALGHKAKPRIARPPEGFNGLIYINPMDANDPVANQENLMACRESSLKFGYRMGIQLHKLINIP